VAAKDSFKAFPQAFNHSILFNCQIGVFAAGWPKAADRIGQKKGFKKGVVEKARFLIKTDKFQD